MFQKRMPPLGVSGIVSGVDRKKLRRALEKAFPFLTQEELDAVLPAKAGELVSVKLAAPSRAVIYKLDGEPIIVDASNKLDLVPTVFALWKAPNMLPRVYVKHPAVTQFIVGGADLMLPGVHLPPEGLPAFKKGDLISVCVHGNPCPLALGTAGMNSEDAPVRKGGKMVEVVQAYGDALWQTMGECRVPNDGFIVNAVVPVGLGAAGLDTEGYQEDDSGQPVSITPDQQEQISGASGEGSGAASVQQAHGGKVEGPVHPADAEAGAGQGAAGANLAGALEGMALQPAAAQAAPEDMDALLQTTLLQALHRSVKDAMLPLTSSVLWAQHMQPMRPAGSSLDVKKSSHKKLSNFLKAFSGKGGLLNLKEDKHSGDQVVTSIDRNHETYTQFRPYALANTAAGAGQNAEQGSAAGAGAVGVPLQATQELQVEELWKPGRELRPVFEALGQQHDALYTAPDLSDIAFAYVTHEQLTNNAPDERTIVLDPILCDALFKGLVKKGELFPTHLPKSELREAFMRRCSAQCRISRGREMTVKKGGPPTVDVSVEKRQGNKRVTRIVGVEHFLVAPDTLASECQKRFASSCTTNELPGKNQGMEVVVQGNVTEHMATFLQDKFSIPKKYIRVKA